jgi:hypothetical protein
MIIIRVRVIRGYSEGKPTRIGGKQAVQLEEIRGVEVME